MFRNFIIILFSLSLASCTAQDPYTGESRLSRTAEKAGIGAAIGALTGVLFAKATNSDSRRGFVTGAGIGALTGAAVGNYQDRQEAILRQRLQNTGVSVTRIGNRIILNMPHDITFSTDSSDINSQFYSVLSSVGLVLKEFNQTFVNVEGHTDSDGSNEHNYLLSERRATSVAQYLIQQGNRQERFYIEGFGESQPRVANTSAENKARNRRVEIAIEPVT